VERPESVAVRTDLAGPIRGRIVVSRTYAWPSRVAADGSARTLETEPTAVTMEVELRADEPFARIGLTFDNQASDHRIRFHAPLPLAARASHAEGQFAVVERSMTPEGGYGEEALATYPAHAWVDAGGLAILLDHVAEYELTDEGRELAVTVLRSIGLISRNDNPYRQDPAGPAIAIPNAQMRGNWRMAFALYPHDGAWIDADVAMAAERYRHPFLTWPGGNGADDAWPPAAAGDVGLQLDGGGIALTSLRRRGPEWLEARVVNLAADRRSASIGPRLLEAREADLRGTPGSELKLRADGSLALDLGPAEIRTVQLRRHETATGHADVLDAAGPRQTA
jgi:alpha-mannosidase